MKLLIAIPALNEEDSIGWIIQQCLAARDYLKANSPVTDVEITVVSDGSTDRTVEIASSYADSIRVIVFPKNRGYGAAICAAWQASDADLLGFLDADGTCDPRQFAALCRVLVERRADVAVGSRMHAQSQMPAVRRLGNKFFAGLLSVLSLRRVGDTASGMRVVRRACLPKLFPLPTGLHFTPAMSARALLGRDLKIAEIDMPYHERAGESKLRPIRDGLRFLRVIVQTAMLYCPARPLNLIASALLVLTAIMLIRPAAHYFAHRTIEEWMIYRFLVGELLSTVAVTIGCVGYLGSKAADIALTDDPAAHRYHGATGWLFRSKWVWAVPLALVGAGGLFVAEAVGSWTATGQVTLHWSRFVAMMSCLSVAATITVTKVVDYCLNLLADRLAYLGGQAQRATAAPEPERLKRAA